PQPRAARPFAGNVEALDVTGPPEGGQRAAHGHRGLHLRPFADLLDATMNLVLLVSLAEEILVDRADDRRPGVRTLDEKLLRAGVGVVEKQLAVRRLAVAARAARLLIVGF